MFILMQMLNKPFKIANEITFNAKVAKFRQIWSHWLQRNNITILRHL